MSVVCQLLINLLVVAFAALFSALGVESQLWISAIVGLVAFALYNGYFILLEWLLNGQTPGKRLLHIRVIKQGGYALRFFDTLLRNLLRVVDFLPLFYGVGLTSLLFTRDSQRLGDLVAGTLVVYQEPVETDSLLPDLPAAEESEPPLPAVQLAAIPDEAISLAGRVSALPNRAGPAAASGNRGGARGSHPRDQRTGTAARAERRELPRFRRQTIRARSSIVIPQLRRRLNSLLDQSPRDLFARLGELSLGVDHSRAGPAVAVATKQGIAVRNRQHRPD